MAWPGLARCCRAAEALREREAFARSSGGAGIILLALVAWAHERWGAARIAEQLKQEVHERHPGVLLSGPLPDVDSWLRKQN